MIQKTTNASMIARVTERARTLRSKIHSEGDMISVVGTAVHAATQAFASAQMHGPESQKTVDALDNAIVALQAAKLAVQRNAALRQQVKAMDVFAQSKS
jgi:hypothetical protein